MKPLMTYVIDLFGPDRSMFESNFPPDKVRSRLHDRLQRLQAPLVGLQPTERASLFHDTAVRVYRVDES